MGNSSSNLGCPLYTQRVRLLEKELLSRSEHLSSHLFLIGFVLLDLQFYMYALQIIVCPFVFFFWPLSCLSIDLRILITPLVSSNFYSCRFTCFMILTIFSRRNYRKTWTLNQTEPVAKNYYPVNSRIYIQVSSLLRQWQETITQ